MFKNRIGEKCKKTKKKTRQSSYSKTRLILRKYWFSFTFHHFSTEIFCVCVKHCCLRFTNYFPSFYLKRLIFNIIYRRACLTIRKPAPLSSKTTAQKGIQSVDNHLTTVDQTLSNTSLWEKPFCMPTHTDHMNYVAFPRALTSRAMPTHSDIK